MSTSDTSPQRTSATVRDPDVAAQIVVDLTERGIAPERVTTRDLDPTEGVTTPRGTGEADLAFTESTGKALGAGWLIAFLIGAVVGALGVSLLFAPPWDSPLAAGLTLAVAIGVGYIAAAMGFIQTAIAKGDATGGRPRTAGGEGHGSRRPADQGTGTAETDRPAGADGHTVEVIVDATDAAEANVARDVFAEHRASTQR
jgi:hypothetical protein